MALDETLLVVAVEFAGGDTTSVQDTGRGFVSFTFPIIPLVSNIIACHTTFVGASHSMYCVSGISYFIINYILPSLSEGKRTINLR